MFQTVRHWWGSGRGRLTVRLFLFELLVVIVGVLIAQGLANWVEARGERAEGERLLADAKFQADALLRDLNYWHRYGPCLRGRVITIERAAATGGSMNARQIGRPGLPKVAERQLSPDDWQKIRSVAPPDQAAALATLAEFARTYNDFIADTARQWAVLQLIDSSIGPPSSEDRSRVRLATTIIDSNVRWMMFQQNAGSLANFRQAGVPLSSGLPGSSRLVDDCGLLKSWE